MKNKLPHRGENLDDFSGSEKSSISLLCELPTSSESSSGRELKYLTPEPELEMALSLFPATYARAG
jgi:hypothetical protein